MAHCTAPYPPIADYALISNCHCAALISRAGSVDWCCMPRFDDDSCFGRLLDWERGGHCAIAPVADEFDTERRYVGHTMILETRFRVGDAEAVLYDFFAMDGQAQERSQVAHVRILVGIKGEMAFKVDIRPRFDYGEIEPYVRRTGEGVFVATGSNNGLIMHGDLALEVGADSDVGGRLLLRAGERRRLVIQFQEPEFLEQALASGMPDAAAIDGYFDQTRQWWEQWADQARQTIAHDEQTMRSAITLKALTYERTGAIVAAATTSLPESIGGTRNWDYRFSWVRDSVFVVRMLRELGYTRESDRFHDFTQRSAAGTAEQLQIMYGVDGMRRLTEIELDWLNGYRGSRPVRVGNRAAKQIQFDIYGELLETAWEWHVDGHRTPPEYWAFLADVVNLVCERWQEKDHGIWEVRNAPNHFVHSKVMCWAALDKGIKLAQENGFDAPIERWTRHRDDIRAAVETRGYDSGRGAFMQAFDSEHVDSALLLLPRVDFIAYDDPRMVRTVDLIRQELSRDGLLLRYRTPDSLPGEEGVFLPCTFWLVACLAAQGRTELAWEYYRRTLSCANDIGLFSEEYDTEECQMIGNFPQALTHVSQIMARMVLEHGPDAI